MTERNSFCHRGQWLTFVIQTTIIDIFCETLESKSFTSRTCELMQATVENLNSPWCDGAKNILWRENSTALLSPRVILALHYPPFVWLCRRRGGRWGNDVLIHQNRHGSIYGTDPRLRSSSSIRRRQLPACLQHTSTKGKGKIHAAATQGPTPQLHKEWGQGRGFCQERQSVLHLSVGPRDTLIEGLGSISHQALLWHELTRVWKLQSVKATSELQNILQTFKIKQKHTLKHHI